MQVQFDLRTVGYSVRSQWYTYRCGSKQGLGRVWNGRGVAGWIVGRAFGPAILSFMGKADRGDQGAETHSRLCCKHSNFPLIAAPNGPAAKGKAAAAVRHVTGLPIETMDMTSSNDAMAMKRPSPFVRWRKTFDAAYLVPTQRGDVPLATAIKALARAVGRAEVQLSEGRGTGWVSTGGALVLNQVRTFVMLFM